MKLWKAFSIAAGTTTLVALAFASSALANTITDASGNGTPTFHFVSEESAVANTKHLVIHNSIANIECESTFEGNVSTHGTGVTTSGPISHLTFFNCTGGWVVTVISAGTLEIHTTSTTGHGVGTVTSSGMTLTTHRFGTTCAYQTANTHIGTLTGGNPATLHLAASLPRHGGSFLCGGSNANWTGAYVSTSTLKIDA